MPAPDDEDTVINTTCEFASGELKFEGQLFKFPDGLKFDIEAKWLDINLLNVSIDADFNLIGECARCLKECKLEISNRLEYLYYVSESDSYIDDDEIYLPVEVEYFGRTLDIMPQIIESIYTLIPIKILCKEDCAGLCPNCGADLNEVKCSCSENNYDPRFEELRNFKDLSNQE